MKDLKEIKYKTGEIDDEGNPVYITEAEYRENGIYTLQEDEDLDENDNIIKVEKSKVKEETPQKESKLGLVISSIIVGLFILFLTFPIVFGLVQILMLGLALIPTDRGEAIGLIIISVGGLTLDLGFAVWMAITKYKKWMWLSINAPTQDKKDSDDISGTYTTRSYTRPDGTKVTHISKKK